MITAPVALWKALRDARKQGVWLVRQRYELSSLLAAFLGRSRYDASDNQWKLILALCRYASLRRPTEVLSLKWADID